MSRPDKCSDEQNVERIKCMSYRNTYAQKRIKFSSQVLHEKPGKPNDKYHNRSNLHSNRTIKKVTYSGHPHCHTHLRLL